MLDVAVVGGSGYAGGELVRLLLDLKILVSTVPVVLGRRDAA